MVTKKFRLISEIYDKQCKLVISSPSNWEAFLRSACYNYKLRFDEQLLVFAQRPDATAVLEVADWNKKFGRWVNRGTHGIAVFEDANCSSQRLVHYFDISDTHESDLSRKVPIWEMKEEYGADVIETIENTFGELGNKETLANAVKSAAKNAVEDNISDYLFDLLENANNSLLDGLPESEINRIFKATVTNSVAFMTMTRLGIDASEYFDTDDFYGIVNFSTQKTLNIFGNATSDIAEMGLTEISHTVFSLERQKSQKSIVKSSKTKYNKDDEKTERRSENGRYNLHEGRRLLSSRLRTAGTTGTDTGQVLTFKERVPEGTPQVDLLQLSDELHTERTSERYSAESQRDGRTLNKTDGSVRGRDGGPESEGYDELGSQDEQYQEQSSGNRTDGGRIRLEYYDRTHEDKSLPFFGGDDTVREILRTTPHLKASKDEIRVFFEANADEDTRTSYIKSIFNNDYTELTLEDGRTVGYKTFENVLHLWEGKYDGRTAQSFYDWTVIAGHFEAMRLLGELQDTIKPLPSVEGQMELIIGGAKKQKPAVFTFSQEIIDAVLTRGSGISEGKMRIYEQFSKSLSATDCLLKISCRRTYKRL